MAATRADLSAALLRHAHEVECRRDRVVRADTYERLTNDAERLLGRADAAEHQPEQAAA